MGFALRISGLCALLAVCAAAGGRKPTPPTISLDLAGMPGGYHDFKLPVGKHPKITAGPSAQAYGKTCEVLESNAASCAEPKATAWDHHEQEVTVSKTTILYIASWPQEAPVEVFREVAAIDYDQRGEYILYYDAKDQSDNAAEQIAFGVILQDTKPPVIKTWADDTNGVPQGVTVESCDADVAGMDAKDRAFYTLPPNDPKVDSATDNYDGSVSVNVTVTSPRGLSSHSALGERVDIDTRTVGTWRVRFAASDFASIFGRGGRSNTAHKDVLIEVQDQLPPTIYCAKQKYLTTHGKFDQKLALASTSGVDNMGACSSLCAAQQYMRVTGSRPVAKAACEYFQLEGKTCTLYGADAKPGFHKGSGAVQGVNIQCQEVNKVQCTKNGGATFTDPGAACIDLRDSYAGPTTIDTSKRALATGAVSVDLTKPGTYVVEYTCSDQAGNAATAVQREIEVEDTTAPQLSMKGNHKLQLEAGAEARLENMAKLNILLDPTASVACTDECDANSALKLEAQAFEGNCDGTFQEINLQTGSLVTVHKTAVRALTGASQMLEPGKYGIKYTCMDTTGNIAALCREVTIEAPNTPAPTPSPPPPTPAPPTPQPTPAPVDCVMSAWGAWEACNEVCGGGVQQRQRHPVVLAAHGGTACPTTLSDFKNCNTRPCLPCAYTFEPWTECSRSCGGGTRVRPVQVQQLAEKHSIEAKSGAPCPLAKQEVCETQPCPRDCVTNNWGPWSSCSRSCGSGTKQRTRTVKKPAAHGGVSCGDLTQVHDCNTDFCEVPCVIDEWGSWSACTQSCGNGQTGGVRSRSRDILRMPKYGAPPCPATRDVQDCNTHPCRKDCEHEYKPWTTCTKSCGGGTQRAEVLVLKEPEHGGVLCPYDMERACNTHPCSVDCRVNAWGGWSQCSKPCEGGKQSRYRKLAQPAVRGGKACPHLREEQNCNTGCCPKNCKMGIWSVWTACSQSCGPGVRSRNRPLLQEEQCGGKPCGPTRELQNCNRHPCPIDCEHTWRAWGACSATCGGGVKRRLVKVIKEPLHGGKACPYFQDRVCNEHACPTPSPTKAPTKAPTNAPTNTPTMTPTVAPTTAPTNAPTPPPPPTPSPTKAPTRSPTPPPTPAPTPTANLQFSVQLQTSKLSNSFQRIYEHAAARSLGVSVQYVTSEVKTIVISRTVSSSMLLNGFSVGTFAATEAIFTKSLAWQLGVPASAVRVTATFPGSNGKSRRLLPTNGKKAALMVQRKPSRESPSVQLSYTITVPETPSSSSEPAGVAGAQKIASAIAASAFSAKFVTSFTEDLKVAQVPVPFGLAVTPLAMPTVDAQIAIVVVFTVKMPTIEQAVQLARPLVEGVPSAMPGSPSTPAGSIFERPGTSAGDMTALFATLITQNAQAVAQSEFNIVIQPPAIVVDDLQKRFPMKLNQDPTDTTPVDCRMGDWSEFSACSEQCGRGDKTRTRTVLLTAARGGQACGSTIDVQECIIAQCPVHCVHTYKPWTTCTRSCGGGSQRAEVTVVTPARWGGTPCPGAKDRPCNEHLCPFDCVIGGWGEWGACSHSCGTGMQARVRTVAAEASRGGKPCAEHRHEARTCNSFACPIDCQYSQWGHWTTCSASCKSSTVTGYRERSRGVQRIALYGGKACTTMREVATCNTAACPDNCVVSQWSTWGLCSKSCKEGTQQRTRSILRSARHGGSCSITAATRTCNYGPCPVHCKVSGFSSWNKCTKSCGGGAHSRSRSVTQQPAFGGYVCPYLAETQPCNTKSCPVDCVVSDWSTWSACSLTCGGGTRVRSRSTRRPAAHGGASCPHMQDVGSCNPADCPIDCDLAQWGKWSTCSKSCGAGTATRVRAVHVQPAFGGEKCAHSEESRACNAHACPEDCTYSQWSSFTACTSSCSIAFTCGTRTRTRSITAQPKKGGKACRHIVESETCGCFSCPVDCVVGTWSSWSTCSRSCGTGKHHRERSSDPPRFGGAACPHSKEEQDCTHGPCPVHCVVSAFSAWTVCDKSCGAGKQHRSRAVVSHARHGGYTCPYLEETRSCNVQACPKDCVIGSWGQWGVCSESCDTGTQMRRRTHTPPRFGGKLCPADVEHADCNVHPCPGDCGIGPWNAWSACSLTCGGGERFRTRPITQPTNGGKLCPQSLEKEQCNPEPCAIDGIVAPWGSFDACSRSCGGGVQTRTRGCAPPAFGGKKCPPLLQTRACNVFECSLDCVVSAWVPTQFTQCSKSCGNGAQSRSRTVMRPAQHGGQPCPHTAETQSCTHGPCPIHCRVSAFSAWTQCTKSCGSGTQRRSRFVTEHNAHGGYVCPYLQETRSCKTEPCPINCAVSDWATWSTCSLSCGGGITSRVRHLEPPMYGGVACPHAREQQECNAHACPMDCVISDWGSWTACTASCKSGKKQHGGTQERVRTVVAPRYGGKACPEGRQERTCNDYNCPVDCLHTDMSQWTECSESCGTGIKTRSLTITRNAQHGGKACPPTTEQANCNVHPCPRDCDHAYKPWTSCTKSCGGGTQRSELIVLSHPEHGGAKCPEDRERVCNTHSCPTDCVVSQWGGFGPCDRTCGTGTSVRRRYVITPAADGGVHCPKLESTQVCNTSPCPVDCEVGTWGLWSQCSTSCFPPGVQKRSRPVLVDHAFGGKRCPHGNEYRTCSSQFCPEDCVMTPWEVTQQCSRSCNGGHEVLQRKVQSVEAYGGKPCGPLTMTRSCNDGACPQHCQVGAFSDWSPCTRSCSDGSSSGTQRRSRAITRSAAHGGYVCPYLEETRSCGNTQRCPVDCVMSDWGTWGSCSRSCGNGSMTRTRRTLKHAQFGGVACRELSHTKSCNEHSCPTDCVVSQWAPWAACSASCSGGTQVRRRSINRDVSNGGLACPHIVQTRHCNRHVCSTDCLLSDWGSFSKCSQSCGNGVSGGVQTRTRIVRTPPAFGGKRCDTTKEVQNCNVHHCPINCEHKYKPWTTCSKSCGGGTQRAEVVVVTEPMHGGLLCPYAIERTCNAHLCPGDCMLGDWGGWSECSVSCGSGTQTRTRPIKSSVVAGGRKCGATSQTQQCNSNSCPVDCELSPWGAWSACSKTCGVGLRSRWRGIAVDAAFGGKLCSHRSETQQCSGAPVINCVVHKWAPWSACSVTCGTGRKTRTRTMVQPACGGTECPLGQESAVCNAPACVEPCVQSSFSDWSSCSKSCGAGVRSRSRSVIKPASGGGSCGPNIETHPCTNGPCPIHCLTSNFGAWTACTKTCGGGTQSRSRHVVMHPTNGGYVCPYLEETRPCGLTHCPVDCELSDWGVWNTCSKTCGAGSHTRRRTVKKPAQYGGASCANLSEEHTCNVQRCPISCVQSDWGQWSGCSLTCGGGERSRSRTTTVQSQYGGTPCGSTREYEPCSTTSCPVDCTMTSWGDWSACPVTCTRHGVGATRIRTRFVSRPAMHGGKACESTTESMVCAKAPCPISCDLHTWGQWSACTVSCNGGVRSRSRAVRVIAQYGAPPCGTTRELEPCNTHVCLDHCEYFYKPWTACTKSCGTGSSHAAVVVTRNPGPGGNACPQGKDRLCNTHQCPGDCVMSQWADFGECTKSCGRGTQTRSRSITTMPRHGGADCAHTSESRVCNTQACPVDCATSDWGTFSACTVSCGAGSKTRTRAIAVQTEHGGRECPHTVQIMTCNTFECPLDCIMVQWGNWSPCTKSCAGGTQRRTRSVQRNPFFGGAACGRKQETQVCSVGPCPIHCVASAFTAWSMCSKSCGKGSQSRSRSVIMHAKHGGYVCPYLFETRDCETQPCPVDCIMHHWAAWGTCSFSCGGGTRTRHRTVSRPASHGGKPCLSSVQTSSCRAQPCPVDCVPSQWSDWGACTATCGGGLRTRTRKIATPAMHGGRLCSLTDTLACATQACPAPTPYPTPAPTSYPTQAPTPYPTPTARPDVTVSLAVTFASQPFSGLTQQLRNAYKSAIGASVAGQITHVSFADATIYQHPKLVAQPVVSATVRVPISGSHSAVRYAQAFAGACGVPASAVQYEAGAITVTVDAGVAGTASAVEARASHILTLVQASTFARTVLDHCELLASTVVGQCASFKQVKVNGSGATSVLSRAPSMGTICAVTIVPVGGTAGAVSLVRTIRENTSAFLTNVAIAANPSKDVALAVSPFVNVAKSSCTTDAATGIETCVPIVEDCVTSSWSSWSHCTQLCNGGTTKRFRVALVDAQNGGRPCPVSMTEIKACNAHACPVACSARYQPWSQCSVSCGTGVSRSAVKVIAGASHGGKSCPDAKERVCNTRPCPSDCQVSSWSKWTDCTVSCGTGMKQRERVITQLQRLGGKMCPHLMEASTCNSFMCPVDCQLSAWSGWGSCSKTCGAGTKTRKRSVQTSARFGGAGCGALSATRTCSAGCCRIDCKLADWSSWTGCTHSCGRGSHTRQRHILRHPACGGAGCERTAEHRECNVFACPVDCQQSRWGSFGACSVSCGGGLYSRSRGVTQHPQFGGKTCGHNVEDKACNVQECPSDCTPSSWSPWGACSKSCGAGTQRRTRSILSPSANGGRGCGLLEDTRVCDNGPCPVHCHVAAFSDWTGCTKSCGGGVQSRSRSVISASEHGGYVCPYLEETRSCNDDHCPEACEMHPWGAWSFCTLSCGGGQQMRSRSVLSPARHGGQACGETSQSRSCGSGCCPVNCAVSSWASWTDCSKTCGTGSHSRTRQKLVLPACGGNECPHTLEDRLCSENACPTDCAVAEWGSWSACTTTCGTGTQTRTRVVTIDSAHGGKACPITIDTRVCNDFICPEDCLVTPWSVWSSCSTSCGTGTQSRNRSVVSVAQHGGKDCPKNLLETQRCSDGPCPLHCETSAFSAWSKCSKSCGSGTRSRSRSITRHPKYGGFSCPPLKQERYCNTDSCPEDCLVSQWGEWPDCPVSCGGAAVSRIRNIERAARHGGKACNVLTETKQCRAQHCPVDCKMSDWGSWELCSTTCGGGTRTRARTTERAAAHGGVACPSTNSETELCNPQACPVDCVEHTWSSWTPCDKTCGSGTRMRIRGVKRQPKHGGKACGALKVSEACSVEICPRICLLTAWSSWSSCSKTCEAGTEHRTRTIIQHPAYGAPACPGLRKERACNLGACPIHCVVSSFTPYTTCSKTCGGGLKHRTRTVTTKAQNGGYVCPYLKEVKACNSQMCPQDCVVGQWGAWSGCTQPCGGGVQRRTRPIVVDVDNGGKVCPPLFAQKECNTHMCAVPCKMSGWSQWTACSRTCGTGSQSRFRSVEQDPQFGGSSCPHGNEARSCNEFSCPVDCEVGLWGAWTACSASCNPESGAAATRTRSRGITRTAAFGGKPCLVRAEKQDCQLPTCAINCVVSQWSAWGSCSLTCGHGGTHARTRSVIESPRFGGKRCGELKQNQLCSNGPCAVHCEVTPFSAWSRCSKSCGGGTSSRTRTVKTHAKHGGYQCPYLAETRKCNQHVCPEDCKMSGWSTWTDCSLSCGTGYSTRERHIVTIASLGGKPCSHRNEARTCNSFSCPVDCVESPWTAWDTCTRTCGKGSQQRTRGIDVNSEHGGKQCGALSERRDCNTFACAVDCELSDWGSWEVCNLSCGNGVQSRSRAVNRDVAHGGKKCSATSELRACNVFACPVDCVQTPWSAWTPCSVTCGPGSQTRRRSTVSKGANGGAECTATSAVRACSHGVCPVHCDVSQWTTWSSCTKTCGSGTKMRTRVILRHNMHGGDRCPPTRETQTCRTTPCDKDCVVSEWSTWEDCTRSCGAGSQRRSRSIVQVRLHNGKPCPPLADARPCGTSACPVDCEVAMWSSWTPCSVTCGGGQRTRTRGVNVQPAHGGSACPALDQNVACKQEPCAVDCVMSDWGSFGGCSQSCSINEAQGVNSRTRTILIQPQHGGKACGATHHAVNCNNHPCPIDCSHSFRPWGPCSRSCDGGEQTAQVQIHIGAQHGGVACPNTLTRTCNTHPCPVDCAMEQWSSWSACSRTCGGGTQTRTRGAKQPQHGGKACEDKAAARKCNARPCPSDCVMGGWTEFSTCTKKCDTGIQSRSRTILSPPRNGGKECPHAKEAMTCNSHSCRVDCKIGDWGSWGSCDKSCNSGTQYRSRTLVPPRYGGTPCPPSSSSRRCNSHACPADCLVSDWGTWGGCSEACGPGVHRRYKVVKRPAVNGGKACPAASQLEEFGDCFVTECPVHCIFDWLPWGECSSPCGGGMQTRKFVIKQLPNQAGRKCPTEGEERVCNTHACPTPAPTPAPTPPTPAPTPAPTPRPYSKPVLSPLDGDILEIEANANDNYVDAGAECSDAIDGDLNRDVRVAGDVVDLSKPGRYEIRYNCANSGGVQAETAIRYVFVKDTTCPVCNVNPGPEEVEASFPYSDPGATCRDSLDGALPASSIQVVGKVNVERTGTYTLTYRVQDKAGNWNDGTGKSHRCHGAGPLTSYTRTVKVVDTLKPVLALTYPGQLVAQGDASDRSTAKDAAKYNLDHENPIKHLDFVKRRYATQLMAENAAGLGGYTAWAVAAAAAAVAGLAMLVHQRRQPESSYVPV